MLCLAVALFFPFSACAGRQVRVGIYQNSPKVAMSESGRPEGIFVDLIEAIAEAEDWSLEYVPGTWREGLERLAAGEIDLMPDVAFTHDREMKYAFHREPVLSDWFQVFARRGSGIRSLPDLHTKRLSLLEGSIQQEVFENALVGFDLNVVLVPVSDYSEAFDAAARGEVDAVIANRFYGSSHIQKFQMEDTAIIFNPTRLFFAAPQSGDPAVLDAIDARLALFKKDPRSVYYQSLQRWTSEDVGLKFPAWLKGVAIGAAGLLLVTLLWSVVLRHEVSARTAELARRNEELQETFGQVKRVEQELRESERKYRTLFENASDAIMLMRDGRFINCNAQAVGMFAYAREDFIGMPPSEVSPPLQPDGRSSVEKAGEKISRALTEGRQFFEWQHCRRDGTPFMAEVSLNRVDLDG